MRHVRYLPIPIKLEADPLIKLTSPRDSSLLTNHRGQKV